MKGKEEMRRREGVGGMVLGGESEESSARSATKAVRGNGDDDLARGEDVQDG